MDIIIVALSRWDGKYSSTVLSLAKVFAKNHRVFYIDNPFTIKDVLTGLKSKQVLRRINALLLGRDLFLKPLSGIPNFVAVTPQPTIPINWLPKGKLFAALAALNDRIVFHAIKKTIEHHNIRDFVYINSFNPLYGNHFPREFKPALSVYHCVDDITESPYVKRHGPWLEKLAINRSGLTITTSSELKRLKSRYSDKVFVVPNAANVFLFQQALCSQLDMPEEIKTLRMPPQGKREIIVYMGNICHRIDYELLNKLADAFPERILLMVGPFANTQYKKSGLSRRRNVYFTGSKKLEELPAYLQYSQCAIIPFLCNQLTRSIYPLKINEYLSAGIPVVTTAFSEDVKSFGEVAAIAASHNDFIKMVDESISTDSPEKHQQRAAFSASNNWEDRAGKFMDLIKENLNGGQGTNGRAEWIQKNIR